MGKYIVKPYRKENIIDFVFEHDGDEYTVKVVERDARQAVLDHYVKEEHRAYVDKLFNDLELWDDVLDKCGEFLDNYFYGKFLDDLRVLE